MTYIRVRTSDTLLGSDPFNKKPNYSCVYTTVELSDGTKGHSVCFTSGAGNDWIAYGVKDISNLIDDYDFNDFIDYRTFFSYLPICLLASYHYLMINNNFACDSSRYQMQNGRNRDKLGSR